jgi:hypothetical protein
MALRYLLIVVAFSMLFTSGCLRSTSNCCPAPCGPAPQPGCGPGQQQLPPLPPPPPGTIVPR